MQIKFKYTVLLDNCGAKSIVYKAETWCRQESIQALSNSAVRNIGHWYFVRLNPLCVASVWVIVILVVQLQY